MEKELTEAMGVLRHVQKIVLRDKERQFLLLDLCAGNALASVLAVHLFQNVSAIAVDKLPRERNWEFANRFQYVTRDVYLPLFPLFDDRDTIVIGVHACGGLSKEIVQKFLVCPQIRHMVLLPCCSGTLPSMPALLHEKLDRYEQWAYALYLLTKERGKGHTIARDRFIQSPKNIVVTAHK